MKFWTPGLSKKCPHVGNNTTDVVFVKSSQNCDQCPPAKFPEFAFIGRSNVGKSSLINMLTGQKNLAKTSGKPGKTQTINHYMVNQQWYIADLPGYGYAKVSQLNRKNWLKASREYLLKRTNLLCIFVLIDARHAPQQADLDFMKWITLSGLPMAMIFTKTDKLKPGAVQRNIDEYNAIMLKEWEYLPVQFVSSAIAGTGKQEIIDFINATSKSFEG
jgi:GTP-binding protein